MLSSFDEYLEVMKDKHVLPCPNCGSTNTTNYNFVDIAECFSCHFEDWDKKWKWKTIKILEGSQEFRGSNT